MRRSALTMAQLPRLQTIVWTKDSDVDTGTLVHYKYPPQSPSLLPAYRPEDTGWSGRCLSILNEGKAFLKGHPVRIARMMTFMEPTTEPFAHRVSLFLGFRGQPAMARVCKGWMFGPQLNPSVLLQRKTQFEQNPKMTRHLIIKPSDFNQLPVCRSYRQSCAWWSCAPEHLTSEDVGRFMEVGQWEVVRPYLTTAPRGDSQLKDLLLRALICRGPEEMLATFSKRIVGQISLKAALPSFRVYEGKLRKHAAEQNQEYIDYCCRVLRMSSVPAFKSLARELEIIVPKGS
jgi:hypothetical protein